MKITMDGIETSELPYERQVMKHLITFFKYPRTMIDVGANIGWYSITLAKLFPTPVFYAFEPAPETYSHLCHNVVFNGLKNRIYPQNIALSDHVDLVEFNYYPDFPAASSFKDLIKKDAIKTQILTMRLDNYLKEIVGIVDFIKIDTEGSEFNVLKGAEELLKRHHPIVQCEMLRKWSSKFNYHPNDIIRFMKKLGYKCYALGYDIRKIKRVTDNTKETNFLFK